MKINSMPTRTINFKNQKALIKKADDFVRKVNLEFPLFSTSYATNFWETMDENSDKFKKSYLIMAENIFPKLNGIREEYLKDNRNYHEPIKILNSMKKSTVGNCAEKTWITLGALYANNYNSSIKCQLGIQIDAIDKRSGKSAFQKSNFYDHEVIMTSFDKNPENKKGIIIDPWLNKAMSYSEAINTYMSLFKIDKIQAYMSEFKKDFIESNVKDYGIFGKKLPIDFDITNYEFKPKILFLVRSECFPFKNIAKRKEFAKKVAQQFPELIFDNN